MGDISVAVVGGKKKDSKFKLTLFIYLYFTSVISELVGGRYVFVVQNDFYEFYCRTMLLPNVEERPKLLLSPDALLRYSP